VVVVGVLFLPKQKKPSKQHPPFSTTSRKASWSTARAWVQIWWRQQRWWWACVSGGRWWHGAERWCDGMWLSFFCCGNFLFGFLGFGEKWQKRKNNHREGDATSFQSETATRTRPGCIRDAEPAASSSTTTPPNDGFRFLGCGGKEKPKKTKNPPKILVVVGVADN
jgi:hypothetical protein